MITKNNRLGVLEENQKATLNIIEDFDLEKRKLKLFQDAMMNLLEDFYEERSKFKNMQKATLNLLGDMAEEQYRSRSGQAALLNILEDIEQEHKKVASAYIQLQELQEKLLRQEKLATLGKLGGTIAHELRNPLGAIRNSVYFLRMKIPHVLNDEKVKQHFDILDEEVSTSDRIITDILTFGRVKEPQLAGVDINNVIEWVLARVKTPENIKVFIELNKDLPHLLADGDQLKQVFSNLILNAIQSMPGAGTLTITGTPKDNLLEIGISDTGEGILKDNLSKIFEPLFSTKIRGTGLGLSVCQSIIAMHKGNIEVKSEPGKGTRFIVKLPLLGKGI
jgi:signal transduction histidine kinase